MSLETATYISQLVSSNPSATDGVNQGDDHIRLIKLALAATFPNFTAAALVSTNAQLDAAANAVVLGTVQSLHLQGTSTAPGLSFIGDTNTGFYSPGADQLSGTVGGATFMQAAADASVNFPGVLKQGGVEVMSVLIGGMLIWPSDTLPSAKWAWANGQAISRSTYATLFATIGTVWGAGDGSTTFNVPDMREVTPVGKAGMGSTGARGSQFVFNDFASSNTLGAQYGESHHHLTVNEMPSHQHTGTTATSTVTDPGHTHTVSGSGTGGASFVGLSGTGGVNITTSSNTTGITVSTAVTVAFQGNDASHNNVQPSVAINYIIRVL